MTDPCAEVLYKLPLKEQRDYVARCLGLGPGWTKQPMWEYLFDALLSVRKHDGEGAFYREVGRFRSRDIP